MEANKSKYKNGKIYRICDTGYNEFYYGSTVQSLPMRLGKHRALYKLYKESKYNKRVSVYDIFDKFGIENCKIELVEACSFENKSEMQKREGYWIQNEACVNKIIPARTVKQYYQDKREQILEQCKTYRENNKEKVKLRNDKYRVDNVEKMREIRRKYEENNKDKVQEYRTQFMREYRKLHPDKFSATICCDVCNITIRKDKKTRHERTKKHIEALNTLVEK
jgi:hypothetical protein